MAPTPLEALRGTFTRLLYLPDPAIVDITAAVTFGNVNIDGPPMWVMLVGPSSSGKTEVIDSLNDIQTDGLKRIHQLAKLTPASFLSGIKVKTDGYRAEQDPSLLVRATAKGIRQFTFKDFTSVLAMQRERRAEVLGDLREIYDGHLTKEVGQGGRTIAWPGQGQTGARFGMLVGVTRAIDSAHGVMALMGERFMYFRLPEGEDIDRHELGLKALQSNNDDRKRDAMRFAMREFVADVSEGRGVALATDIPDADAHRIVSMADLTTRARTGVDRSGMDADRDIRVSPSPEMPGRLVKQLGSLYWSLNAIEHEDSMAVLTRIARDSMPESRWSTLNFIAHNDGTATITDVRHHLDLPSSTTRRILEDMAALRLIHVTEYGRSASANERAAPHKYGLTANTRGVFESTGMSVPLMSPLRGREGGEEGRTHAGGTGVVRSEVPF